METPEQVLAKLQSDVTALRRRGMVEQADLLGKVADDWEKSLEPIRLVTEIEAMTRSGKKARWLRAHHATWAKVGGADWSESGERLYRLCVLPTVLGRAQGEADAERVIEAMR